MILTNAADMGKSTDRVKIIDDSVPVQGFQQKGSMASGDHTMI